MVLASCWSLLNSTMVALGAGREFESYPLKSADFVADALDIALRSYHNALAAGYLAATACRDISIHSLDAYMGSYRAVTDTGKSNEGLDALGYVAMSLQDAEKTPQEVFETPLWSSTNPSREFGQSILESDPLFDFFRRWYDGMVTGTPLDWELQRRVALIDPEIWESGDAQAVAEQIARVEAEWLAQQSAAEPRAPEYEPDNVVHLFTYPRSVAASVSNTSTTIVQNFALFQQETKDWLNHTPVFLAPLEAIPATLDRIEQVLAKGHSAETEQELREQIGRLNAKVAQLEQEVARLTDDKESQKKPWFVAALKCAKSSVLPLAGLSIAIASVSAPKACENMLTWFEMVGAQGWLDCGPAEVPNRELPDLPPAIDT